jgi:hypothetical protein
MPVVTIRMRKWTRKVLNCWSDMALSRLNGENSTASQLDVPSAERKTMRDMHHSYVAARSASEAIGKHARSAVGMAGLPGNAAVEVEMIVEVE